MKCVSEGNLDTYDARCTALGDLPSASGCVIGILKMFD